ncbi:MAG: hypothetical protein SGJ20_12305 [Planctomycetota bacterium]|nr:hypothetical protein [Planctomycetota bacterium]
MYFAKTSCFKTFLTLLFAAGWLLSFQPVAAQTPDAPAEQNASKAKEPATPPVALEKAALDPAWAEIVQLIPEDAAAFLLIKDPTAAEAKAKLVGKQLGFPVPNLLELVKQATRAFEGVDESGSIAVLCLPTEGAILEKPPLLLIKVSDYVAFVENFTAADIEEITPVTIAGEKLLVAQRGSHAVLTLANNLPALRKYLASGKSITSSLTPMHDWMNKQDVVAIAQPNSLQKEIDSLRQQLERVDKQLTIETPGSEMLATRPFVQGYCNILQTIRSDLAHIGLAIRVEGDGGLNVSAFSTFAPDGATSKAADKIPVPNKPAFAELPNEPFILAAEGALLNEGTEALAHLVVNSLDDGIRNSSPLKELNENLLSLLQQINSIHLLWRGYELGRSPIDSTVLLLKVADAETFTFVGPKKGPIAKADTKTIQIEGVSVKKQRHESPAAAPADEADARRKRAIEIMVGDFTNRTQYEAAIDKHTFAVTCYAGLMRRAIQAVRGNGGTLADREDVQFVVKQLPANSQLVLLVHFNELIKHSLAIVVALLPPNSDVQFPKLPPTQPVGFGIAVNKSRCEASLVVPATALHWIGNYVRHVQAAEAKRARALQPPAQ